MNGEVEIKILDELSDSMVMFTSLEFAKKVCKGKFQISIPVILQNNARATFVEKIGIAEAKKIIINRLNLKK